MTSNNCHEKAKDPQYCYISCSTSGNAYRAFVVSDSVSVWDGMWLVL